jgi:hypothetical protein
MGGLVDLICSTAQLEYFSEKGWTGFFNIDPTGKSASLALTGNSTNALGRLSRIAAISFDSGIRIDNKPHMPKKPGTNPKGEFAFFNVVYEDGSQRSNRRVPSELLGGLDGDEPARAFIHEQDREIAEKSGRPPLEIKAISRVGAKKK